jgi:hypothetical protein
MIYEKQPWSVNILSGKNWVTLFKYWTAIVITTLIILLITYFLTFLVPISTLQNAHPSTILFISFMASIIPQMLLLSMFENFDGCYKIDK